MRKHHSQDKKEEEEELSKFEKLVQVCKITLDIYYNQAKFQQVECRKQNNIKAHSSVPNKEIGTSSYKPKGLVSSGKQVSKRSCKKAGGGEPSYSNGRKRSVVDHDYLNDKEVLIDRKGKKKLKIYCDSEDYEYSEKNKKVQNNVVAKNKFVEIAPLPLEFESRIQEMGGDDVKLIIQKHMFKADVDQTQNRFSIPVKQIREDAKDFLTLKAPLDVPLIDPNLTLTQITIRKWSYSGKSSSYTLSGPWSGIRRRNNLRAGMVMQLWSFRVDGKLNLALVKVSGDDEQDHEISGIANTSQINVESHDAAASSSPYGLEAID